MLQIIMGLPVIPPHCRSHVESLLSFVRVNTRECWVCIVSSISSSSSWIPVRAFVPSMVSRASHPKATAILLYSWMRFGSSTQHVAGWHNTILGLLLLQEVFVVQTQPDWCHSGSLYGDGHLFDRSIHQSVFRPTKCEHFADARERKPNGFCPETLSNMSWQLSASAIGSLVEGHKESSIIPPFSGVPGTCSQSIHRHVMDSVDASLIFCSVASQNNNKLNTERVNDNDVEPIRGRFHPSSATTGTPIMSSKSSSQENPP